MHELGLDLEVLGAAFTVVQSTPYVVIEVPVERAKTLAAELGTAVRRFYVSDPRLEERSLATAVTKKEFVEAKIPDRGSVMAGDFGEILTAIFQGTEIYPQELLDPKKWRLKQDRTKPAPHSDVVQFVLPSWPDPSEADQILCTEVKTKSTKGTWTPIEAAIADSKKDQAGRLAKTLVWLRERALDSDLGTVSIDHLNRFIQAVDHPPASRVFRAVAVICSSLLDAETKDLKVLPSDECALIVISVPDLKSNYEELYDAVVSSVEVPGLIV